MQNQIKTIYKSKLGKYVIFPGALILLWFFLTFIYILTFDTSFSILSYSHAKNSFTKLTFNKLYKGNEIVGGFKAQDNNLGIVSIRFQTFIRPPYSLEDHYVFRIKEKGANKWYYQNIYRSGLIYDTPFFPFGFPIIKDSKGRTYIFELVSLNGSSINALSIRNFGPILITKYKYTRDELMNKEVFLKFLYTKIYNSIQNPDVYFSSFIYLLPFFFYLFWISFFEKYFVPFKKRTTRIAKYLSHSRFFGPVLSILKKVFILNLDVVIIFIILLDILIVQITNDIVYLIIISLWIITLRKYKKESNYSFFIALTILLFAPLFLFLQDEPTAEKATIWAYMLIIAGTIQIFIELKEKPSKLDSRAGK